MIAFQKKFLISVFEKKIIIHFLLLENKQYFIQHFSSQSTNTNKGGIHVQVNTCCYECMKQQIVIEIQEKEEIF